MAENSIDLVRRAEAEADETVRTAARRATELQDKAHMDAAKLTMDSEDAAHRKAGDTLAEAYAASEKALQQAAAGLQGELEALAATARKNQPKAIQIIVGALV